jgi:hypothetical protein
MSIMRMVIADRVIVLLDGIKEELDDREFSH